jgi:hypothetical protein
LLVLAHCFTAVISVLRWFTIKAQALIDLPVIVVSLWSNENLLSIGFSNSVFHYKLFDFGGSLIGAECHRFLLQYFQ